MNGHRIANALVQFAHAWAKARVRKQPVETNESKESHAIVNWCLFLIYYFSLCDFLLKYLPTEPAIVLRYFPEALLYLIAIRLIFTGKQRTAFPLILPLCACASSMIISALLNSVSVIAALGDFRLYFRFAAFAYIAWKVKPGTGITLKFMKGFLGLTVIELIIGVLEMFGGESVQLFFAPVLNLISGNAGLAGNQTFGEEGWIFGTLSNYNHFGMFMSMSCVLALGVYVINKSKKYLGLSIACALFVVFSYSRHSLLVIAVSAFLFFLTRNARIQVKRVVFALSILAIVLGSMISIAKYANKGFQERMATLTDPRVMATDSVQNIRFYIMAALPPLFLKSYPFFGQGPMSASDKGLFGDERDLEMAEPLKAAPQLPGIFSFYLGDVVWVMILGLYGCMGLAAIAYLLWRVISAANRIRKISGDSESLVLARVCLSLISAYVVAGFFSEEVIARDCIPVFWVLIGLTLAAAEEVKNRQKITMFQQLVT